MKGYENGDGGRLEELLRVVLWNNPNLIVIFPEIMVNLIYDVRQNIWPLPICNQYDKDFEINLQLEKHYDIGAIVKISHIPCQLDVSNYNATQRKELISKYQLLGGTDPHPTPFVHNMTAEFVLHFIYQSLHKSILIFHGRPVDFQYELPDPFFRSTVTNQLSLLHSTFLTMGAKWFQFA